MRTSDGVQVTRSSPDWMEGLASCAATASVVINRQRPGVDASGRSAGPLTTLVPTALRSDSAAAGNALASDGTTAGAGAEEVAFVPVLGRGAAVVGVVVIIAQGRFDDGDDTPVRLLSRFSCALGAAAQVADECHDQVCSPPRDTVVGR